MENELTVVLYKLSAAVDCEAIGAPVEKPVADLILEAHDVAEKLYAKIEEQKDLLQMATQFNLPHSIVVQKRENNLWVICTGDDYIWDDNSNCWSKEHHPFNMQYENFKKNTRYPLQQALEIAKQL